MLYYRYRPISELSLKELRYGEMYFSSTKENNDPYDGKVFLSYEFDEIKWKYLFERAWLRVDLPKELITEIALNLSKMVIKNNPKTYEDVMSFDFQKAILASYPKADLILAYQLSLLIKQFIEIYTPEKPYTVSFSKKPNDMLMWSHYASQHKGYCLVFRELDGCLYQNKLNKITTIRNLAIGDKFQFCDVSYVSACKLLDASRFMPAGISDITFQDEADRLEFIMENENSALEKHICWEYEKEARLLLYPTYAWIMGKHIEFTKEERLFYYEPTQLVGIILGALMDENYKDRVKEIVKRNNRKIAETHKEGAIFDFVLFEASMLNNRREVSVQPTEIYRWGDVITKDNKDFYSRYQDWNNGWALVFNGQGGAHSQQFS